MRLSHHKTNIATGQTEAGGQGKTQDSGLTSSPELSPAIGWLQLTLANPWCFLVSVATSSGHWIHGGSESGEGKGQNKWKHGTTPKQRGVGGGPETNKASEARGLKGKPI